MACLGCSSAELRERADASVATTDSVADTGPGIEQLCDERADLVCGRFDVCAGYFLRLWYVDEAACRAGEKHNCVRDQGLPGIVDPIATLSECVESLRGATCSERGNTRSTFCAPRRPGLGVLPYNSSCFVDAQCAGGACGLIGPGLFGCGACRHLAVEGDACKGDCGGPTTELRQEMACDPFTSRCTRAVVGATCTGSEGDAHLYCTAKGVWAVPTAKLGDPCEPYRGGCTEGFCDLTTAKCAPLWLKRFARPGEPCGRAPGAEEILVCTGGTYCGPIGAPDDMQTCQPPRALGAKCGGGSDSDCGHSAFCVRTEYALCSEARPVCPPPRPIVEMDAGGSDAPTLPPPAPPSPPVLASDINAIEIDDLSTGWKFAISGACRVTDAKGLDKTGDPTKCAELFKAAVDGTWVETGGCGKQTGMGTTTMRTKDGRVFVRDHAADRCAVLLPSIMTEKYAYVVWTGVGGK